MSTEPLSLSPNRGSDPFPVPLRLRVLIVDDNKDSADATAELLSVCGATTQACYRGMAALTVLGWFRPDACVLDLTMPGMDGCELARRLRAEEGGGKLLIVALTALGDEVTRDKTAIDFDLHLVKPVDPTTLRHHLGEHMKKNRSRSRQ